MFSRTNYALFSRPSTHEDFSGKLAFAELAKNLLFTMTIMIAVAGAILVAFGLFLISLTVVIFAKPAVAERFFLSFASSARAHYTEQAVRLLIGASLMIRSAAMWQPKVFWFIGCAIVLSSLVLILTPWQWHDRFGDTVRPMLIRQMKLFAIGISAFGVLLIYGVLSAASPMSLTR